MLINLLMTGNELMTGVTIDRNSAWLAEQLLELGLHVNERRTVGDELSILIRSIKELSVTADLLIVNGGLGPTSDDLTAQALAQAAGVKLTENLTALAALEKWGKLRNIVLNDANLKQIYLPSGCSIISNPTGSASGFSMELNDCIVICTPGVPSELKAMYNASIMPLIENRFKVKNQTEITRIQLFGAGESSLQQLIHDELKDWPEQVEIGFRAGRPLLELKLTTYNKKYQNLRIQWQKKLEALISQYIIGYGNDNLASAVVKLAKEKTIKLTTAESCTGGKIASEITSIAGASAVFECGIISYSNSIKEKILNVSEKSLEQFGAVSEIVVREMLVGALNKSGANIGVAVSGIAGPDGGSEEKPVGTVWIAWGSNQKILAEEFLLPFGRSWFQELASALALDLIRRFMLGEEELPDHMKRYIK